MVATEAVGTVSESGHSMITVAECNRRIQEVSAVAPPPAAPVAPPPALTDPPAPWGVPVGSTVLQIEDHEAHGDNDCAQGCAVAFSSLDDFYYRRCGGDAVVTTRDGTESPAFVNDPVGLRAAFENANGGMVECTRKLQPCPPHDNNCRDCTYWSAASHKCEG